VAWSVAGKPSSGWWCGGVHACGASAIVVVAALCVWAGHHIGEWLVVTSSGGSPLAAGILPDESQQARVLLTHGGVPADRECEGADRAEPQRLGQAGDGGAGGLGAGPQGWLARRGAGSDWQSTAGGGGGGVGTPSSLPRARLWRPRGLPPHVHGLRRAGRAGLASLCCRRGPCAYGRLGLSPRGWLTGAASRDKFTA
jgi:hypothetical protein